MEHAQLVLHILVLNKTIQFVKLINVEPTKLSTYLVYVLLALEVLIQILMDINALDLEVKLKFQMLVVAQERFLMELLVSHALIGQGLKMTTLVELILVILTRFWTSTVAARHVEKVNSQIL